VCSLTSPTFATGTRYLALFSTDDLLTGELAPHPVNEQALYMYAPHGTGRNAGGVFRCDDRLFRPMQKSECFYGEGMTMMEIVTLTAQDYGEMEAQPPRPFEHIVGRRGVHHVSQASGMVAWDRRTRWR